MDNNFAGFLLLLLLMMGVRWPGLLGTVHPCKGGPELCKSTG